MGIRRVSARRARPPSPEGRHPRSTHPEGPRGSPASRPACRKDRLPGRAPRCRLARHDRHRRFPHPGRVPGSQGARGDGNLELRGDGPEGRLSVQPPRPAGPLAGTREWRRRDRREPGRGTSDRKPGNGRHGEALETVAGDPRRRRGWSARGGGRDPDPPQKPGDGGIGESRCLVRPSAIAGSRSRDRRAARCPPDTRSLRRHRGPVGPVRLLPPPVRRGDLGVACVPGARRGRSRTARWRTTPRPARREGRGPPPVEAGRVRPRASPRGCAEARGGARRRLPLRAFPRGQGR